MPKGIPKNGVNKGWFRTDRKMIRTAIWKKRIGDAVRGEKNYMFGKKHNAEHNKKISDGMKRATSHMRDQKNVSLSEYTNLHGFIRKNWGQPQKCESCGRTTPPKSKGLIYDYFHWANKDGKYKLERKDWLRLCAICHRNYDYKRAR
jgi:hypothetical protein